MRFIRQIIQQLGLSPREGGGGAKRFCLPLLALICAAALAGLYLAPSRAEDYWSDAANKEWYGDGAQTAYTMEKMTLRVGEGWPSLPVVYVKPDGTGDGSSWANAMGGADFSARLKWINTQNSGKNYNFYVAKGTYAQTETLPLPKGVKLYGGFAGTETETIASRDIKANVTTLTAATGASISIVTGGEDATSADTVLDGFTITGGKGTDPEMLWYSTAGGGLFNDSSSPLIANCTFSGNYCYAGPAIFNCRDSSPYVYRCSFEQNEGEYGGAVCSESCYSTGAVAPSFVECVFYNNFGSRGGAIYSAANGNSNTACTPFIDKCRFLSNQTTKLYGGAITDEYTAHSTISNSEFTGNFTKNVARASGGAIFINAAGKTSVITNCTFANNKANGDGSGGALYVNGLSSLIIANCTFSGNVAANKGGAVYSASTPVTAVNSIFWGDTAVSGDAEIAYAGGGSSASLYNSVVQGGWTEGGNNISEIDPMFLTASPDNNGGPVPTIAVSAGGSAFRAGVTPGTVISGDFKTPLTDARGVSFDVTSADIGAYAWRYAGGNVAITTAGYSCEIGDERTVSLDSTVKAASTDAVDKGAVKLVTLSSSNTSAAVVSGDAVRAVGRGTATISGSADGSPFTVSGSFTVTAASRSLPKAEVTEDTRTDTTGAAENASGIVVIGDSTAEDFALYDGFDALAASGDLPVGINASSVDAITKAQSKDIEISSRDIFSDEAIKKAIGAYWQLGETSADKVHMVQVRSATGETQGVFAKIWSLLKSFFINGKDTYDSNKYLPLQANFVISSADVAELPEYVRSGLTKDTLLAKLNLFVLVKSGDAAEPAARSLSDITSNEGWISVADDGSGGYIVKTRLMVFDQIGGVTTGTGAKWVQKFAAKSADKVTDRAEGNYFLVQDGKADQEYAVAMAFAAKEHNYATLHVTVETASGDIPASADWSVSGDNGYSLTGITSSDWTAVVSGDANYTFTFPQYAGYTVSPETTSRDIKWGGSADIKVLYSQIHAESVSLDKTAATLDYWSAASHDVLTLTATISPDKTLDKTVSWATSDANIAEVDQSGNVTPTGKGKATITASAEGKTASCDVTVIQRIDNAVITVTSSEVVYTGGEIKPDVTVTLDGTALKAENYEVSYTGNTNVGTATVTVKGTAANYYGGEASAAFAITAKPITVTPSAGQSKTYGATEPVFAYSSSETGATFTGALARETGDNVGTYAYTLGSLSAGTNYTLTLNNNADKFKITAKDAAALNAALSVTSYVYDGAAKEPAVTVKDGETKLVKDTDYTVTYDKNTNVGTATAKATFIGNYKGEKSVTFEITPKKTTLTIDPIADQTYTGGAITPAVTVKDGEKTLKDTDYTLSWANNVKIGTATVTATGKGNYEGSTGSAAFRVIPIVAPSDVTESTRTDGDNSGILPIADGTTEDFAIFDAMRELAKDGKLASGISYDAKALAATSADIDSSAFLSSADIKAAIGGYWNISGDSENKVRLVEVQNTVATRAGEGETIFAKFWKMLVSLFKTNNGEDAFSEGDYLPVQANFTIRSADIAELPDEVKEGLTKDNLIDKISLFTIVVDDKGEISARSLVDVAGNGKAAHITVTGDSENGYAVKTRVMLFDMEGGLSGDKTTGAKWVQPLKVSSSDQRTNEKDNYFIVQDGAKDGEYKLCLAFAAKEANYASVSLTTSGDIESKDIDYVRWAISGDAAQHEADSSADIRGDEQSVTLIVPGGYHVTLSDETQTLSRDVKTISADVTWGGEWKITALFEKIKAESVTLDKTTLALAVGGNAMLTAAVTPDSAYAKDITWTTSDGNVAEVAADGTITAKAAGKATITAAANDGSGAKAECAVTVRKSAADDPAVTPAEPEAVKPEVVTPNENVVPVTPGYVTDPVKQEDVMNEIGLKAEDTAVTENGSLTVTGALADKAAGEVIANDPDTVSKDSVISLPVTVSSADEAGMIHALGFKVSGDVFGKVDGVGEIRVLKVFTDGGGKAFTVVTAAEAIADKTVALYDANNEIVTGAIDAAATYTLTAFVLDGGEYDLDGKTDGKVIDPIAIIKQAEPPVSPTPTPTGGSGGGCNAGAGALALAALIPLAVRRGKR